MMMLFMIQRNVMMIIFTIRDSWSTNYCLSLPPNFDVYLDEVSYDSCELIFASDSNLNKDKPIFVKIGRAHV